MITFSLSVVYLNTVGRRVLAVCLSGVLLPAVAHADTPIRRTEVVMVDPILDMPVDNPLHLISNVIYVNRCIGGCTLTPGANDSRGDTVSFIQSTVNIDQFMYDEATYQEVIDCVRQVYLPYNVDIVTEEPAGPHHEAILAGVPGDLGLNPQVGGIAPAACSPIDNAISFSFANNGQDVLTMCWTVAQESAHAFGLPDHVFDCSDPMTYIPGCGTKFFRDEALPCGEFALNDKPCRCGRSRQNSHQVLLDTFGPGEAPPPPDVSVALPEDGSSVTEGFSIYAFASDPRLVERVELWLNGNKYLEVPGHDFADRDNDYFISAPTHADGFINVEIRAYNDLDSMASASNTVLKGDPCQSDSDCFDDQSCNEGACSYPPASGVLGDDCSFDQQCVSALCVGDPGEERCSTTCDLSVEDSCPSGFTCLEAGNGGLCWPDGGGCCSVGGGSKNWPPMVLGLFLSALLMRRKRRRRTRP